MSKLVRISAALTLGSLAVSGCTSGNHTGGETPSTVSSTTSITPATPSGSSSLNASSTTGAAGPLVPEAARAHTDAGAVAFAKFYINTLNELGLEPKKNILDAYALPSCKTCDNFEKAIDFLVDKDYRYSNDVFAVNSEAVRHSRGHPVVTLAVTQNAKVFVQKSGATIPSTNKQEGILDVSTVWQSGSWHVSSVQV